MPIDAASTEPDLIWKNGRKRSPHFGLETLALCSLLPLHLPGRYYVFKRDHNPEVSKSMGLPKLARPPQLWSPVQSGVAIRDVVRKPISETWHNTANELEVVGLPHNDALLVLDETELAADTDRDRAKVVLNTAFRLEGQVEKRTQDRHWPYPLLVILLSEHFESLSRSAGNGRRKAH
jgi:hypothetical protein